MKQPVLNIAMACMAALFFTSCATVKPYQKNKINDSDMSLGARKTERPAVSFQTFREGSSGASGGKSGGGCGCN